MTLTLEEVEHIALLARLELSQAEKEHFREQLSAILDYAARLQALDLPEAETAVIPLPEESKLRPDQPRPGLDREALLRNAPETAKGQFRVPPIFD